jgi:hypothetical protein
VSLFRLGTRDVVFPELNMTTRRLIHVVTTLECDIPFCVIIEPDAKMRKY